MGQFTRGGGFTTAGGTAAVRLARWNGSTWTSLSSGANANVEGLTIGLDGMLFACGAFETAGGTAASGVARWNGSTWSAMASGINNVPTRYGVEMATGLDGSVYVAGNFVSIGGVSACFIARWNGIAWQPLANGTESLLQQVRIHPTNGNVYVGGDFEFLNGTIPVSDGLGIWSGTTWLIPDINLPGASTTVTAVDITASNILTVSFESTGTACAAAVTTITNSGTATAYPILTASAPTSSSTRFYQLVNYSTGDTILFNNLTLLPSEVVTLDLRPGKKTFTSSFRGNIINTILPGSNVATWRLLPGSNAVSFWLTGGGGNAKLTWVERFWSLDG